MSQHGNHAPVSLSITARRETAHDTIERVLWQCLAVGALAVALLCLPGGYLLSAGSGMAWLLLAPMASLLVFYRDAVAAAWRGILVPSPRRRWPRSTVIRNARKPARRLAARVSVPLSCPGANHAISPNSLPRRATARR